MLTLQKLFILLWCLAPAIAGCAAKPAPRKETLSGTPPPAPEAEETLSPEFEALSDPDTALREAAERSLVNRGPSIGPVLFEALARCADPEQRARLLRVSYAIERASTEQLASTVWKDRWFVISKGGWRVGFEHDSCKTCIGYYEEDTLEPAMDGENLPPTEQPALGCLTFSSELSVREEPGAPTLLLQHRSRCRYDNSLSPIDARWSASKIGPSVLFAFYTDTSAVLAVTNAEGREVEKQRFPLGHPVQDLCLESNASLLIERAALVERPEFSLQLFRCSDAPDGKTIEYQVRLEGRDTMTWDGEKVEVLKYVQVGPPTDSRDVYYVSKERGLMAGRIRGYDIVRLRRSPFAGESPESKK